MSDAAHNPEQSAADSDPSAGRTNRIPRMQYRARNHQSAHAESDHEAGGDPAPNSGVDHPLVPRSEADLVTTAGALSQLIERLGQAGRFAYDSEFIGEQSYIPKLCLIQVATSEQVSLIDPLAGLDLTPFWELTCEPAVEKIVHAGQQDVEPVYRLLGKAPANLFDTQIAAGFVRLPYPLSLSKLVQELVGARLGKGLTFTNWDQRPLSRQQIRYAGDDVRYLPAARQELGKKLDALGHAQWAAQASAELCALGATRFDPEESFWKIRGASSLDSRNLAVLRELTIWRDAAAREADVPPRTFLKDEVLLALARSPAKTIDKLKAIRGLPRPVEAQCGTQIVAATAAALSLPASNLPRADYAELSPGDKFKCDALWAAAQAWCYKQGVDPNLVSSRQEIGDVCRDLANGSTAENARVMRGWRRAALGEKLIELRAEAK